VGQACFVLFFLWGNRKWAGRLAFTPPPPPPSLKKKGNALGNAPPFQLLDRLHQQLPGEAIKFCVCVCV